MGKLVIGIDIGGTRTKIGLVDLMAGKLVHSIIEPTEKESAARFENRMAVAIRELMVTASAGHMKIDGVGFGVPSFVWTDGTVDSTYGFLKFMEDYPLVKIIESASGIPCRVDNDARTVALGEALFGQGIADLPPASLPEIAFAGRSNAGKSSAINVLTQRKRLAFASKTPGRTQLLNFFEISEKGERWSAGRLRLPGRPAGLRLCARAT